VKLKAKIIKQTTISGSYNDDKKLRHIKFFDMIKGAVKRILNVVGKYALLVMLINLRHQCSGVTCFTNHGVVCSLDVL